jgi:putative chitobiose transport system substrate-binding protein
VRMGRSVKNLGWLCLCSFFLIVSLAGCSTKASQLKPQKIILEFWTLQLDTFKSTLEPMFLEYERKHPDVQIKWVDVPFSEGSKRTLTAMMSGHTPDVINLNPDFSAILASRNALVNMNKALPQRIKEHYLPVAWQAATLNQSDGTHLTFGLPWYITSSVTLYNKTLLKKAGYQKPPATFAELADFAESIQQKTHSYGLMPVIAEQGNFLKELQKMGVELYDGHGRAIFATAKAMDHLASFVEMYQRGWVPAEALTESYQAAVGRYQAGTLASFMIGPNFLKIVKENAPDIYKETGIVPQFPEDSGIKDFALMVLVVPTQSAHQKEALDFATFITNATNQLAFSQAAPVLPSITTALQSSYFSQAASQDLMAQGRSISAQQLLKATTAYQIRLNQNAINEIIDHYVQLAMLGKIPPSEALRQAQHEINATLEVGS